MILDCPFSPQDVFGDVATVGVTTAQRRLRLDVDIDVERRPRQREDDDRSRGVIPEGIQLADCDVNAVETMQPDPEEDVHEERHVDRPTLVEDHLRMNSPDLSLWSMAISSRKLGLEDPIQDDKVIDASSLLWRGAVVEGRDARDQEGSATMLNETVFFWDFLGRFEP